jgi:uncharacterized protein (TIGR02996 family)
MARRLGPSAVQDDQQAGAGADEADEGMSDMTPIKRTSAVQAAAQSLDENAFITALVANMADEAPRLIYADWLEERGDSRVTYVRDLASAISRLRSGTRLPESTSHPRSWTNMLGVPLFEGIVELDLEDVREEVLRLAKPIVSIETEVADDDQIPVGASRFGGYPDLPNDVEWPACAHGPLGFLGQINLADLNLTQVGHTLPRNGLLSIFAYQDYETGYQPGTGPPVPNDTRIIWSSNEKSLATRAAPPNLGNNGNGILPVCSLKFVETWDLPDIEDNFPPDCEDAIKKLRTADRSEKVHQLRCKLHDMGHHLMGYSFHSRCPSDPSPGLDWRHALLLFSDDNLGWSWCDGQHLAVFVHENDIRDQSFRRVYGYAS